MKLSTLLLAATLAVPAMTASASGDTLLIQRVQATQGMSLPVRGQTQEQVVSAFGEPVSKYEPVGGGSPKTPPITRWSYPSFSVYFENDRVISAVLNKSNPNEIGPLPVK